MNFPDKPSLPLPPEKKEQAIVLPSLPVNNDSKEEKIVLPPKPELSTDGEDKEEEKTLAMGDTDFLIHPETGEKFDPETGEPVHDNGEETVNETVANENEKETTDEKFSTEDTPSQIVAEHSRQLPTVQNIPSGKKEPRWSAGGRPSENKTKIPETITAREWDDNTEDDPVYGLGAEKEKEEFKPKTNKKIVLNERDYIMMAFMAKHKYCYSDQLARLVKAENKDVRARLTKLEKEGYIRREIITRGQDLWLPKKAGLQMIGSPYAPIQKGQIPPSAIQHTIGVGNIAVELEMGEGAENILGEKDFPKMNRYQYGKYDPSVFPSEYGEMTISEKEIRSSNRVLRGGNQTTTLDLREEVKAALYDTSAPERLEGNEWMFVVYSKGEHFPDLVVSRPRTDTGKPQHLAIELELTAKDLPSWRRILKWYRDDGVMFDKVYYFTHSRTIATRIKKVVDELDLADFVILRKYIPKNDRGPFWG